MLNQIQLIGNLGKDPELSYTPTGKAVTKFSVAVSRSWTAEGERKTETTWFDCQVWDKQAENAAKLLTKGKKVFIQGRMTRRKWTDPQGITKVFWCVVVTLFELLSPKPAGENGNGADPAVDAELPAKSETLSDDEFV